MMPFPVDVFSAIPEAPRNAWAAGAHTFPPQLSPPSRVACLSPLVSKLAR